MHRERISAAGLVYALAAYLLWGVSPVYWKLLAGVPAFELLAHRVIWCALLLAALMALRGTLGEVRRALAADGARWRLLASTVCIGGNWLVYIWAVMTDQILAASLGYYINPLVSVLLGVVFLRERLGRRQRLALLLAGAGVAVLTVSYGAVPWISLALAFSFGFYGLLRKTIPVGAEAGVLVETGLLAPWLVGFLVARAADGGAFLRLGRATDLLLVGTGVITLLPLVWFTRGARLLPLSTIGLLQYLAPTLQFLLAVLLYGEIFTRAHAVAFALIWVALAILSSELVQRSRPPAPPVAAEST